MLLAAGKEDGVLLPGYAGESHPVEGYSGYTRDHLPVLLKNTEAIPASFAARMAFSNFWMRWLLK